MVNGGSLRRWPAVRRKERKGHWRSSSNIKSTVGGTRKATTASLELHLEARVTVAL